MKIGIYGGSFNPIHKGHIAIATESIEKLGLDKLYFVPNYKSPFKTKIKSIDVKDRINMINLVKPKKTEVSLFEANRKGISYTIDTVRYFKNKFPNDELFFIIGTDNLYKLHKWKFIDEISSSTQLVAFRREGKYSKENIKKFNIKLLKNDLFNYTSTKFRKGYLSNSDFKVIDYISNKNLYILNILISMVDARRYKHCLATGELAVKYAKKLGINSKKAWFAGVCHDITKEKTNEWHREFLETKGYDSKKIQDYQLHSLTAYFWLKDEYRCKDEQILNSIKIHTSLDFNLSTLDKIIYAADKLSEGRKFHGIQKLRELMFQDFNKGFKELVRVVYNHLKKERGNLDLKQIQIYESLIK